MTKVGIIQETTLLKPSIYKSLRRIEVNGYYKDKSGRIYDAIPYYTSLDDEDNKMLQMVKSGEPIKVYYYSFFHINFWRTSFLSAIILYLCIGGCIYYICRKRKIVDEIFKNFSYGEKIKPIGYLSKIYRGRCLNRKRAHLIYECYRGQVYDEYADYDVTKGRNIIVLPNDFCVFYIEDEFGQGMLIYKKDLLKIRNKYRLRIVGDKVVQQ